MTMKYRFHPRKKNPASKYCVYSSVILFYHALGARSQMTLVTFSVIVSLVMQGGGGGGGA